MDRLQWPRVHREQLLEALDVALGDRDRRGEHVPLHHLGARRRRQRALVTEDTRGLRQERRRVEAAPLTMSGVDFAQPEFVADKRAEARMKDYVGEACQMRQLHHGPQRHVPQMRHQRSTTGCS